MPHDTYTHGHDESVLRSHTWRTAENSAAYLIPYLSRGDTLLDIGCGPGTISNDFARIVAPGKVVGSDIAPEIVQRASDAPHPDNVTFEVADAYDLQYPDNSFDVVHAHQLLQHLSDPVAALKEMRRVLKPNGVVAVRDSDKAGFMSYPEDPRLVEWIDVYLEITKRNGAQAKAGRYLLHWIHQAGFTNAELTTSNWVFADAETRQWWGGLWADRIDHSSISDQAVSYGIATREQLKAYSQAYREWSSAEDSVFVVPHFEVIGRKSVS